MCRQVQLYFAIGHGIATDETGLLAWELSALWRDEARRRLGTSPRL